MDAAEQGGAAEMRRAAAGGLMGIRTERPKAREATGADDRCTEVSRRCVWARKPVLIISPTRVHVDSEHHCGAQGPRAIAALQLDAEVR